MSYRPTWCEVDVAAIRHNVRAFRRVFSPEVEIMAVVKADGYGHGAPVVARAALEAGATQLGVATLDEAVQLRENGLGAPILVLGPTEGRHVEEAFARKIAVTVFDADTVAAVARATERRGWGAVHLKVDTGMGRLGVRDEAELINLYRQLLAVPALRVEGLYSHLACADEADPSFSVAQHDRFRRFVTRMSQEGLPVPPLHLLNSAGALRFRGWAYRLVRIGISLYGYYPSVHVKTGEVPLRPALTWKTRVAHVKDVPPGTPISYGATYRTTEDLRILTLPVGYADGFSRLRSNRGHVLVRGRRAPIVGRVCMDQTMVAVPRHWDVQVGEEVVLLGTQGAERIDADEIAREMNTISYEVLTLIGKRVPRVSVDVEGGGEV
nr:alanine racemase [Bacillota bacterium]